MANWIRFVIVVAALVFLFEDIFLESYTVTSPAMKPTLEKGDKVLLWKFRYNTPRLYDTVLIRSSRGRSRGIKRIVALPGQCLRLVDSWQLVVSGRIIPTEDVFPDDARSGEQMTADKTWKAGGIFRDAGEPVSVEAQAFVARYGGQLPGPMFPIRPKVLREDGSHRIQLQSNPAFWYVTKYGSQPLCLAANEYFVLGDNRYASADSRDFGPVRISDIAGKAVLIWHSVNPETRETRLDRMGMGIR